MITGFIMRYLKVIVACKLSMLLSMMNGQFIDGRSVDVEFHWTENFSDLTWAISI